MGEDLSKQWDCEICGFDVVLCECSDNKDFVKDGKPPLVSPAGRGLRPKPRMRGLKKTDIDIDKGLKDLE